MDVVAKIKAQTIDVPVTANHIRDGRRRDPCRCALALAIHAKTGWIVKDVGPSTSLLRSPSRLLCYRHDGADLVFALDEDRPVVPQTVRLYIDRVLL